jgi:hypothetical protein
MPRLRGAGGLHPRHASAPGAGPRSGSPEVAECRRTPGAFAVQRHGARLGVCPEKADVFSGCESRRGKSQTPRSLDGRGEGNRTPEAHRRSHQEDGERVTGP